MLNQILQTLIALMNVYFVYVLDTYSKIMKEATFIKCVTRWDRKYE